MKQLKGTTSVRSNTCLLESMVENYINSRSWRKPACVLTDEFYSDDFEPVSFCSAYAPVQGSVAISVAYKTKKIILTGEIMINTSFLVTCTKGKKGLYRLTLGASLS